MQTLYTRHWQVQVLVEGGAGRRGSSQHSSRKNRGRDGGGGWKSVREGEGVRTGEGGART